ncbi:MAG: endonuclease III [Gemmatimonadota bacterium]
MGRRKGREGKAARKERASRIFELLADAYPDAACALAHRDPYQLAVATILSAQCMDARVNQVTPALFARFPDARALSRAGQDDLEGIIRSTGFFRNKAKNLIGMAREVVARHDGEIPRTMEELSSLPGIGRKTANVILGNAFGVDEGIVVDTHVRRLSNRLELSPHSDPVKIERDLVEIFPRDRWTLLPHLFIFHGRAVCVARRPRCDICALAPDCPSSRV